MSNGKINIRKINRFCVVCEKEFGPELHKHCTDTSVVAVKTMGLFKRRRLYINLDGKSISNDEILKMKEYEKNKCNTYTDTSITGKDINHSCVGDSISTHEINKTSSLVVDATLNPVNIIGDQKLTATTRQLCVAAHLDWNFRQQVIERLLEDDFEALGPSFGVDLVTVLRHSIIARRRKFTRDILLAPIFCFLVLTFLLILNNASKNNTETIYQALHLILNTWYGIAIMCFLVISWIIVFVEEWINQYKVVGGHLSPGNYDPDFVKPRFSDKLEQVFKQIAEWNDPSLIVYTDFSPFVGSGFWVGGWTLVSDVDKGKKEKGQECRPIEFTLTEFYDYIIHNMKKLKLNSLNIEQKLHVDGTVVRNDKRFLKNSFGRPRATIEDSLIEQFKENPTEKIRYYLSAKVTEWDGQLILSVFLRFFRVGEKLYAEISYHILPPLSSLFHQFDNIKSQPSLMDQFKTFSWSLYATPFILSFSPFVLIIKAVHRLGILINLRNKEHAIRYNPIYDYGAKESIRELVSSPQYRKFFQRLDKEMYLRIIERQILNSIISFLDGKNVDTSDLREREQVILNESVSINKNDIGGGVNEVIKSSSRIINRAVRRGQNETEFMSIFLI